MNTIGSPADDRTPSTPSTHDRGDERTALAIRGGAIRVAGYAVGVLVSLGTATILLHHLGIANFGRYVTVISLIALVGGVTEAGIFLYGIREFSDRAPSARRELVASLLATRLALTAVGIVVAACFAIAVGYDEVLVAGTLVVGVTLLLQVSTDALSIPLLATLHLGRLTAVDLSRRIAAFVLIAALALLTADLLPFFAASTVAGAVALGLVAWMVRSSVTLQLSFDWRELRSVFADTLPLAIATSIGAMYFYVTVIVMSLIASARQTGLFATSFRVTQVALGVPVLLLTAIFPLMIRPRGDSEGGGMIGKVFRVAATCGLWMSLALALGASFIIDVIAGNQGRGAVAVLQIQAVVLTAAFISTSSGLGLVSRRNYRSLIYATLAALALNIALSLALVPAIGARGGALSDVVAETALAFVLTYRLTRLVPEHGIKLAFLLPFAIASGLAATVVVIPVSSFLHALLATIIYFAVLFAMRAIPPEVTAAVRRVRAAA